MVVMPHCILRSQDGHVRIAGFKHLSREQRLALAPARHKCKKDKSVILVEFRDEVYAPVSGLLRQLGFVTDRVNRSNNLAAKLISNPPDLVLLNAMQPDESAWLTCAKLRILDASLPVWIYSPNLPGALDQWVSMARINDVIIYGGVLSTLLQRLEQRITSVNVSHTHDSKERKRNAA